MNENPMPGTTPTPGPMPNPAPQPTPMPNPMPGPTPMSTEPMMASMPNPGQVPTPTAPMATPVSTPMPNAAPKKKTGLIVGILIGILVLCGGALAAFFLLGAKKDPDTIVSNAFENLIATNQNTQENIAINGYISIGSDGTSLYTLNIDSKASKEALEFNLGLDSPMFMDSDINIGANVIVNKKNLFVKTDSVGELLSSLAGIDLSPIDGQWYQVKLNEVTEYLNVLPVESDDDISKCINDEITTLNAKRDEISKIYRDHRAIVAKRYTGDAIKTKKDTLYEISLDQTKLVDFLNALLIDSKLFEDFYSCMGSVEVEPIEVSDLGDLTIPTIYAEIDNNDKFTRFYLPITSEETEITIDFSIDYPAKVEILEPVDAKDIDSVLEELMSGQGYDYDYDEDLF